jgi:hypothetical protein
VDAGDEQAAIELERAAVATVSATPAAPPKLRKELRKVSDTYRVRSCVGVRHVSGGTVARPPLQKKT